MAAQMLHGMPHGHRSLTEYSFSEEQGDEIVRVTSHHWVCSQDVICFSPFEHDGRFISPTTPSRLVSSAGLGSLDCLPLELLPSVLLDMDIQSLFNFRQLNLRARKTVDSLKQYQMVVSHGLNLYCALLRTSLAPSFSLLDCYNALCTKTCTRCGEFAGFLSLLTWNRCCSECLRESSETQVRPVSAVEKLLQLTTDESRKLLREFLSFRPLPRKSSMYRHSFKLVSLPQAQTLYPQKQLSPKGQPVDKNYFLQFNCMGGCALPYYDPQTGRVDHGMSCVGCKLRLRKSRMPESWEFAACRKVYTREDFLEHFRWCEPAQLMWKSRGEGKHEPR